VKITIPPHRILDPIHGLVLTHLHNPALSLFAIAIVSKNSIHVEPSTSDPHQNKIRTTVTLAIFRDDALVLEEFEPGDAVFDPAPLNSAINLPEQITLGQGLFGAERSRQGGIAGSPNRRIRRSIGPSRLPRRLVPNKIFRVA
jgi:hypothetical protein